VSGTRLLVLLNLPDPEHSNTARAILVLGYALATWFWWRAGKRTQKAEDAYWWRLGAGLLALLTINKIFDLRLASEDGLRTIAKAGGWYEHRQPVQFALAILLPLLLTVLAVIFLRAKGIAFFRTHLNAAAGWILLLKYHLLRQVVEWKPARDWVIAIGYFDWRIALEAGGIALVILSAFMAGRFTTGFRVSNAKG